MERASELLAEHKLKEIIAWRRLLHQHPELWGHEAETAARVVSLLARTSPDTIVTGLGGHGVAAVYNGPEAGPRVLLSCELDGLPIEDLAKVPHRSVLKGKGHQCGHNDHMATMAAVATIMGKTRPATGSVTLLFQPAEETGAGARAVLAVEVLISIQN